MFWGFNINVGINMRIYGVFISVDSAMMLCHYSVFLLPKEPNHTAYVLVESSQTAMHSSSVSFSAQ